MTDDIKAKATELHNNPVEIYNWVRNNVQWLPTWGAIQTASHTLSSQSGNAFDIASLTIALLRASVKLTAEPLDFSKDDHVRIFASTYERFPKLGIRVLSTAEKAERVEVPEQFPHAVTFVKWPEVKGATFVLQHVLKQAKYTVSTIEKSDDCIRIVANSKQHNVSATLTISIGASQWLVIDTDPPEFLMEKGTSGDPLLVEWCRALKTDGGLFSLHSLAEAINPAINSICHAA